MYSKMDKELATVNGERVLLKGRPSNQSGVKGWSFSVINPEAHF